MSYLNSKFLSGFSPQNIPGLVVWLDAADSNSITQSGGVVSLWKDKSPNALDVSQNTAGSRPTYESNVQNGLPAIRFTTSQMMQSTQNFTLSGAQTWFISFKALAAGNLFFVEQGPNTNSTDGSFLYGGNNSLMYMKRGGAARFIDDPIGRGTSPFSSNVWYIGGLSTSNINTATTDTYWSINGVYRQPLLSGTIGTSTATNQLYINNTARVPGSNYTGEIIIYNQALSSNQMRLVERYLAAKWGVTLSNTHPYFSVPASLRPFNPLDISGCNLWLDAADFRSFDISGASNVSRWRDKTGLSNDMTVFIGTPTYSSLSPPRVSLDGASALQNTTTTNAVYTSFYVFLKTSSTGPLFTTSTIASTITGFFPNENGTTYLARSDAAWYSQGSTISNNQSNLVTVQYDSASNAYVWLNGALNLSTTVTGTITRDRLLLGLRAIPNFNYMTGNFYEVIQYDRAISTLERQQVELYLAEKWGLRGNLSSSNALRLYESLSPVFSPALLSNCTLWLDAADAGTMTFTGANLSTWRDKSGSGNNGTATGTITYTGTINGTSVLQWTLATGTNYVFGASSNTTTTASVFAVFNMSSSTGNWSRVVSLNTSTGDDYVVATNMAAIFRMPGGTGYATYRGNAYAASNTTATFNVPIIASTIFDGTSNIVYVNGSGGAPFASSASFGYTGYAVGQDRTASAASIIGSVAEVLHFPRFLTTAERQLVEGYLANKWGLASSLPSNHPYRTIRV